MADKTPSEVFGEMKAKMEADPSGVEGINAIYQFNVTATTAAPGTST